jgi:cytochrome c oxidase cbb3-type subunit I/II
MLTFGMLYWLIPRIFQTKLHSERAANWHFWIATLGILFYALPLYWAGFTQAMMWKQFRPEGMLTHPNFLETVLQIIPMYAMRVVGGTMYLAGAILMTWNLWATMKGGSLLRNEEASAPALVPVEGRMQGERVHRWLERKPTLLLILSLVVILLGGIAEMVPTMLVESNVPTIEAVTPYTPLELEGRDLYIREGCNNCHSQMIRPFPDETERYGPYSRAGEFVYDHPFLWGSKRTGPDLQREGDRYPDSWHFYHMMDPESMSPGSIMPRYPWLIEDALDTELTNAKIEAMRTLGVPYPEGYEVEKGGPSQAMRDLQAQADAVVERLDKDGVKCASDREIVALIAYLQRLGTDFTSTQEP